MSNLNTQLELLGRENNNKLDVLSVPRKSIIESIFKDEFWNDSAKKLEEVLAQTSLSPLIEVPLDEDISAGKNTYTYDAHTYHTKVPPQGISKAIKYYLPQY